MSVGERTEHGQSSAEGVRWYARSVDEVVDALDTDERGLSGDEARRRHERHGPNRLREQEETSPWRVLLHQFTSPLIYILLASLVITVAIGSVEDSIAIAVVLVINATIGFVQEYRAEQAVRSLMEVVSPDARVLRDGEGRTVDAEVLVPGDVVLLGSGEVVPADVRLVEVNGLRVDESALTGESVPVDKQVEPLGDEHLTPGDQTDVAFMGTAVTSGDGKGVVVEIGGGTELGRIAEQVEEADTARSPLTERIERLARWIAVAVVGLAVGSFALGTALGRELDEMVLLAVAIAVAAVPEGLPIVVTVALAIGVSRMARREALIRNLRAVDTLGSCSVIVSDKTGTLTENRMSVRAVAAGDRRFDVDDDGLHRDEATIDVDDEPALRTALVVGALCNDASPGQEAGGDPMERALADAAETAGVSVAAERERAPRTDTIPFRTERRFMATIHDDGGESLVAAKGAPEQVASMCDRWWSDDGDGDDLVVDDVVQRSEELAREGLRVLAMAVGRGRDAADSVRSDEPGGLALVGLTGLLDPPRDSAIEAVDRCHGAGIRVAMVTGDHAATARAIGRSVHLDRGPGADRRGAGDDLAVVTGAEMADMDDDELDRALDDVVVFARVAPDQKLRLVQRLQDRGEVVAVTGDGVNDAPALESAHLGAAMGSGTDVAKEASDMVITDDDFASVYAAVEEGRTAFRNIRMATFFLLSTGAAVVLAILVTLALDWPLLLLPAQILWLNVVTNGIADVALAFEPGERELFRRPPRPPGEGVLDRLLLERLALVGVWLAAGTLAVFWWLRDVQGEDLTTVRTATLTTAVLFQMVHVFNCRSEDRSIFRTDPFSNRVLLFGVAASIAVHVAALHLGPTQRLLDVEPLGATHWAIAVAVAATAIIVNELHKAARPHRTTPTTPTRPADPSPAGITPTPH